MKQKLVLLSASLIGLTLFGTVATAQLQRNVELKDGEGHEHKMMEIPDGQPIPTVDLIVHRDALKGWNLELKVTNFAFAPEKVNQSSNFKEGHAHLYVNGKKITRLYGNWYYLDRLEPGRNEIKVSLNANGHETFIHRGKAIEDVAIVEVR
ncbi:MAG: hypothetical protein IGR93_09255 [Hydrococcus sp. C42_A2020_068]|uniref:hypothetical protein n=1 Tax=Pleurocapsa sp. PCC 7327 TaxID=118163 RepID=UPI00029F81EE|nr:hypothetical protein [Pleurocapsa sp. PCC 7327]AFY78574.1 hypothetical protein Ple7327_3358 [Pleurocapsa sp. PCC 7327]MBF2020272.1 hypothetical protein [Hydrococcus sp. C42_A2020_068]